MYVNCTAKGKSATDAAERRLRVLRQLKEYNNPQLWGTVSPLILDDGKLDLTGVITGSNIGSLEWVLTTCAVDDVRKLL